MDPASGTYPQPNVLPSSDACVLTLNHPPPLEPSVLLGTSCVTGHSSVSPFGVFILLFFHFFLNSATPTHLQNVATATTPCDPSLSTHSEDHPLMSLTDYPLRSPTDPSPPRRITRSGRQQTHLYLNLDSLFIDTYHTSSTPGMPTSSHPYPTISSPLR